MTLASHQVEVLEGLWSVGCSTSSCTLGLGSHATVCGVTLTATTTAADTVVTGGTTGGATAAAC
jgi:hypothetical protein